jgi:hypothetical protein
MATFDLKDVEIFKAGKWNGDTYTEKDLADIVTAHEEIGDKIKPFLKLGHSEEQTLLQKDGLPAAGWFANLKMKGDALVADILSVPRKIYDLIKNKGYGRFSPEIYWNLKMSKAEGGGSFRRALKAVALLGGDTPACTTIDDFINLYCIEDEEKDNFKVVYAYDKRADEDVRVCDKYEKFKKKESIMPLTPEEIADLQTKVKTLSTENETLKADSESDKEKLSKLSDLEKENKDLKEDKEKNRDKDAQAAAVAFLTENKEKISPAQEKFYTALILKERTGITKYSYIENDKEEVIEDISTLSLLQKIFDDMPKFIEFSEQSEAKKKVKKLKKDDKDDDSDLDEKVQKYMKDHPETEYREALLIVGKENNNG